MSDPPQAFAAGALLAMLADTLLAEAYAVEGVLTGPLVVTGFAVSLARCPRSEPRRCGPGCAAPSSITRTRGIVEPPNRVIPHG